MRRINILLLQTSITQSPSAALRDKNVSDTAHTNIVSAQLIYSTCCSPAGSAMKYKGISCSAHCPFPFFLSY